MSDEEHEHADAMSKQSTDDTTRPPPETATAGGDEPNKAEQALLETKGKRRVMKGKLTRAMNRIRQSSRQIESIGERRIKREMEELKRDFSCLCDLHSSLYELVPESEHNKLDRWETDLSEEVFSFEEEVEDRLSVYQREQSLKKQKYRFDSSQYRSETQMKYGHSGYSSEDFDKYRSPQTRDDSYERYTSQRDQRDRSYCYNQGPDYNMPKREAFDSWIDDLTEFRETRPPELMRDMSVAEALHRLEANKDMPSVKLCTFDGSPMMYVEFVETFKVHVHDKPHLTDSMRMVQLKMHLEKEAERAISGLGCNGVMYATALKMIKEQFGQPSIVARSFINKLTKGPKLANNNRQGLRDLSHDIINSIAALQRMNYFADANATDNLRQIVMRLPDYLISKWKVAVTEIRENGHTPTLEHISKFIRKQVQSVFDPDFGDLEVGRRSEVKKGQHHEKERKPMNTVTPKGDTKRPIKCYVCEDNHRVSDCPTYRDSSITERVDLVKKHRLCFSCLIKGHLTRECRSKKACGIDGCTKTHHQSLHVDGPPMSAASPPIDRQGMLPVVRVRFRADNGRVREGNVLIDSGAAATVIRSDFSKALGLQGRKEGLQLSVVGGEQLNQSTSRRVKFWISPAQGGEEFQIEAHELDRTVMSVPPLDRPWLSSFPHMSDLEFSHRAGPVDLILGVQYSHLHAEDEVRQGLPYEPVAKRIKLGWFVIGADSQSVSSMSIISFVEKIDMNNLYDMETLGIRGPSCSCPTEVLSRDDKAAMDIFESSCRKTGDRYTIALPWKKDPGLLPDNFMLANKRLQSLEKSLGKNPQKAEMYNDVIKQYEENGWSVLLTDQELQSDMKPVYYLPHHGVYRPDNKSTPLRIVFDPACKFNGVSLNSYLYKGPCLIGDLFAVLLRFREEEVAFMGDISKMFLQILLPESDSQVHRFLWRDDKTEEPKIYRLTRVTFGDKPSPDMASFVMLRIAREFKDKYPEAATILERDRYVDDLIHSCQSHEDAKQRMQQLTEMLASGSFKIKEWFCSSQENTGYDVQQDSLHSLSKDGEDTRNLKTLGIHWNPRSDTIRFKVQESPEGLCTKRNVLSKISMIYDPLGLASAATIKARMMMQSIWRLKIEWDDQLPAEMQNSWRELFTDLRELETIQFPRCVKPPDAEGEPELHVFGDASSVAYGAAAYLLWPTNHKPSVRLVSAKARVAPLKQTTVPRLELMAALIASRLARTIADELKTKPKVTLWTDSQIVLHWLHTESTNLKTFIGVRVAEIQSTWTATHWMYVPTAMNPADDLSRGLQVARMSGRWMNGPAFLRNPKEEWPEQPKDLIPDGDLELRKPKSISTVVETMPLIDCHNFSSWRRLVRVTAYCLRFLSNIKKKISCSELARGVLQAEELNAAEEYWIKQSQMELSSWKEKHKDLAPFKEENGVIRVGGRLGRSSLPYEDVHPILLSSSSRIAKLIMKETHAMMGHPGCERTLCFTRRRYWIVRGRNLARETVRSCVTCRKLRQPAHSTLMGDLPPERLKTFSPVFSTTGIDLFGPFHLKYGRNKTSKAWGAIFTCGTTRAIHLEIVDGLSTQAFLQALRRFVAYHGWPITIISDNGTSFVGAEAELRKFVQEGRKQLEDFAMLHKVKWIFITPLSPHQGGFYESLIKQIKRGIQVAIGLQTLTWNEMATVFVEVKCLVNSRPLGYSSNDPNDLQPITPNHFILGRASADIPQGPFEETKNLHKRFEFVQSLVNQFWKRFIKEYIPTLTRRTKWKFPRRQIRVGDIVLLTDPCLPRGKWDLARVTNVFKGPDDIIRNVEVKTKSSTYRRSIQRCCLILESDQLTLSGPEDVANKLGVKTNAPPASQPYG